MGRKCKINPQLKIKAVKEYLSGIKSAINISDELSVDESAIRQWTRIYQSVGESGLITKSTNTSYSKELKIAAVEKYLAGNGSQWDICLKYGLRSTTQLRKWIIKYNSHEEIKASGTGGNHLMTKGRRTTIDERVEIVKYCLENDKNYTEAAKKYKVSYQQVRNWLLKYEDYGIEGLMDSRGKRKKESELSEIEKLIAQNKLLEAKNKRFEIENELLKKLEEIERG